MFNKIEILQVFLIFLFNKTEFRNFYFKTYKMLQRKNKKGHFN